MRKGIAILLMLLNYSAFSQIELQKIEPKAPNTAAIIRIAENNISHYTGAADISFPIHSVQSGGLQMNLSLSYSSTGNKVEDIASWVGLGWSLGSIPVITRTVRGLPDEAHQGVSIPYNGTIPLDSIILIQKTEAHPSGLTGDIICQIAQRVIDTEPDIFNYVLPDGRSGTFYWDPYQEKFQTQPYRNLKISKFGAGVLQKLEIVDEFGNKYVFDEFETTQSAGYVNGSEERNGWYMTKAYNANKTDSITFAYSLEILVSKTLNPQKKEIDQHCPDNSSLMSTTTFRSKTLNAIYFKDGYIALYGRTAEREDVDGAHALQKVSIYNYKDKLIKSFVFDQFYTTGHSSDPLCNMISSSSFEKKRMFLGGFTEVGDGGDSIKYTFDYNTTIQAPCRVSSAQDFWGYYNGEIYNENLVPEIPAMYGPTYKVPGAKRFVNPDVNQFGILTRINYPTGGKSEYEYETHQIISGALPGVYYDMSAYLTPENEIATNVYADTITLASDEDNYINNWDYGGSFVDIILGDKECTGGSPPPNCAEFYVRGIDAGNSDISFPLTDNIYGHRLKKGRYEIKASFGQAHTTTQGFFMLVKWREEDTTYKHTYVGGLRVKQIKQFDNWGNVSSKKFLYQTSLDSDTSSGVSLSSVNLIKNGFSACITGLVSNVASFIYQESNAGISSYGGSYVGYNRVFELIDSAGINGYTDYEFLPFEVILSDAYPYIPPANTNDFRAKPISIKTFRKQDSQFQLIQDQSFGYDEIFFDSLEAQAMKAYIVYSICGESGDLYGGLLYSSEEYWLLPSLCKIREKATKTYDPDNGTYAVQTENYYYNTKNYELEKLTTTDSKGQVVEQLTYYAIDSASSGIDTDVWEAMIAKNMIAVPTKVVSKRNSVTTQTVINKYDHESTGNKILLKEIHQAFGSNTPENKVSFVFSSTDRLIEQQLVDNVKEVYIWGYGNRYPVAKISNSTYAAASAYIDQSTLDNPLTSDAQMRTELQKIRNGLASANSQVVTYTYKPLVGITSQTDPNGRTTFYEYDHHSRLAFVRDQDSSLVRKMCYNYAGQPIACSLYYSVAKSGAYTRNNCGSGYTGSTVTYNVAAGKYTSTVSQAAADALAQADVTANGQAYANSTGTCTQSVYAQLTYENYSYGSYAVYADVVVRFYSDAACTIPLSVTNINLQLSTEGFNGSSSFSYDFNQTVSGSSYMVQSAAELTYDDGMTFRFRDYYLLSGTGYTVVW